MSQPHGGFGPAVPVRRTSSATPRRTIVLLIALALAVLASAGGLVRVIQHRGAAEPESTASAPLPAEPTHATLRWRTPMPDLTSFTENVMDRGLWITGDSLVQVMPEALVAHSLKTGEEQWSMPLAAGAQGCGSSPAMDAQRIAVLAGMYCEHLMVVDLTTGEQVVTIALESARLLPSYGRPAILGDTVVVGSAGGGAGFRISDGEQLWWSPLDAECVETSFTVANGAFVSRLACGYDCNGREECFHGWESAGLRATTEDGRELWRWVFDYATEGSRLDIMGVLSVEPLVIVAGLDMYGGGRRIYVVEDPGESVLTEVGNDVTDYRRPCTLSSIWLCPTALVGADHVALSGWIDEEGMPVIDLVSGELRNRDDDADARAAYPVAVVEGEFLAYRPGMAGQPGSLVAMDPRSLEERTVMTLDGKAAEAEQELWTHAANDVRMLWDAESGTFVMAAHAFASHRAEQPADALLVYR